MYTLTPSLFAADLLSIKEQLEIFKATGVHRLHIDIMDGHFVPSFSFGPGLVAALQRENYFELDVHLMAENPELYVSQFAEAGADILTVRYEACSNLEAVLKIIRENGMRAGLAVKPQTGIKVITPSIWKQMDMFLVMSVQPGVKNQSFTYNALNTIREAKEYVRQNRLSTEIEVDGGITMFYFREVLEAGADAAVVGRALFHENLIESINTYRKYTEK